MIPILLEFEAFGPFVARQVIDFTEYQNDRLFLITGNTGAGKTTIFDAISFSLYGQASGCVRQSDSFKSDFANNSTLCYASFTFIVRGKSYTVYREPIQIKLKRGGKLIKDSSTATLKLEDGSIISGCANVDHYIETLLGLNSDQFRKIVMLPQDEFRRFLTDDSNEKQRILRKIFSTKLLDDFTEQLRVNAASIKSEVEQLQASCNVLVDTICSLGNDEIQTQKKSKFVDIPYLITILAEHNDAIIEMDSQKLSALSTINMQRDALNLPYYKEINNSFAQLERLKTELYELEECHEQFVQTQVLIGKLQSAQVILPIYDGRRRLLADIELIKNRLIQYQQDIQEYAATANSYSQLIVLSEKSNEVAEEIKSDLLLIEKLNRYKKLLDAFLKSKEVYQRKFHSFINGQAFLFSVTLKDNQPCPICGSLVHPNPASDNGESVSKVQLDSAKNNYEKSAQQVESIIAECRQLIKQKAIFAEFDNLVDYIPFVEQNSNELLLKQNELLAKINHLPIKKSLLKSPSQQQLDKLNAQLERGNEAINQNSDLLLLLKDKLTVANTQLEIAFSDNSMDEDELIKLALKVDTIGALVKKVNAHNDDITAKKAQISALNQQLRNKSPVNLTALQEQSEQYSLQIKAIENEHIALFSALTTNEDCLERLKKNHAILVKKSATFADVNKIFEVANGKYSDKLNFERYVLATYFDCVINNANLRLEQMTNSRYTLFRREQKEKLKKASGLSLDVFDAHNGKSRHVNTLSGGESFKVALALALGFADIISQNSGGIELNTMFIDEGFGSLDSESLDNAIDCLHQIRLNGRYIGIISHVSELKEKITSKIMVKQCPTGSTIYTL